MKEEIKEITIKFDEKGFHIFHVPEKIPFWDMIHKLQDAIYFLVMNFKNPNKENDN